MGGHIIEKFAASLAAQLAASSQPGGSQPGDDRPSAGRPAATPGGANGARRRVAAAPTGPGHGAISDAAGTEQDGSGPGLPIEELGLPLRAFNSLRREGIHTVGDLSARNEADLLAIANLGPASVREIKQKLAERGLKLAPAGAATAPAGAGNAPAGVGAARDQDELPAAPPAAARPPDEDAIDLLSVAGFPVLKRALPIAGAAVVLLLVLLRTRRRHHRRASASPS